MKSRSTEPNRTLDGQLACAFGELWLGPHYICQAAVEAGTGKPARLSDWSCYKRKQLTAGDPPAPDGRLF